MKDRVVSHMSYRLQITVGIVFCVMLHGYFNSNWHTVQLRCKRTSHTRIIRVYFAYSRMSIRAHMRVYTRTYVRI